MPTFDTPEPIVATIDIAAGHVRIHASDRADTVVEIRPGDESKDADVQAAEQTQVEYANGQLLVKAPKNKIRSLFGRPASIDVTVDLPSDSRVDAKGWADFRSQGRIGESTFDTAAGSIRLDQTGRLKLRTAAGNVSVGRSGGHTDVSTSSGKIWIGEIDGTAVVKTSNGDITVGEVTGDVRLNTANGDITVHRALAAVGAKTAFGSVRIGEVVRGSVLTGHVVGSVIQTLLSMAVVIGVALLIGFRPTAGSLEWIAATGVLTLFVLALTWLSVALGLVSKSVEAASNAPMPLMLLPFLGSGFVPTESMPVGLRWFAEYQPFTPVIKTLRGLLLGTRSVTARSSRSPGALASHSSATSGRRNCSTAILHAKCHRPRSRTTLRRGHLGVGERRGDRDHRHLDKGSITAAC